MELRPYIKRETLKRICTWDSETDPFSGKRVPSAFTCGFYDGEQYVDFWGVDCIEQFVNYLRTERAGEKLVIFCHNFGGFDYKFIAHHIDEGTFPTIINGRVSSVMIAGHEFRDSYRIIPVALRAYQKDDFDYTKLEADVREAHKDEILLYQRHDCEYLHQLVVGFFDYFGDRPTIGNTAMNYLQNFHGFEKLRLGADQKLRPFFMGGRCQNFVTGVYRGAWKVYDVNSMYPSVMRNFKHPVSAQPIQGRSIQSKTAFVMWEGQNDGAVPMRGPAGELDFTQKRGRFHSTIHEIEAGLDTGRIRIDKIVATIGFETWTYFDHFIDHFYTLRLQAKANGDKMGDLFYKLIMNSAYGKFAQDPSKYEKYCVSVAGEGIPSPLMDADNPNGWRPRFTNDGLVYWAMPSPSRHSGFFNVGVGASITGAARSVLLRAINVSKRVAYCDTDSMICEDTRAPLDDKELGKWKLEATGDLFACAGKKMYALFSATEIPGAEKARFEGQDFWCVKKASKGAVLTAAEILRVAQGEVVRYKSDRPNFKLDGTVEFIERDIRRTS